MSEDLVIIVPKDPQYLPDEVCQRRLAAVARELAPAADEITTKAFEGVRFIDCGSNFERAICPRCGEQLSLSWWQHQMSADFDGQGFCLASFVLPCCGATAQLNEIHYDWPQAFGRFICTMRNPGFSTLPELGVEALESALGGPVSIVRSHV